MVCGLKELWTTDEKLSVIFLEVSSIQAAQLPQPRHPHHIWGTEHVGGYSVLQTFMPQTGHTMVHEGLLVHKNNGTVTEDARERF